MHRVEAVLRVKFIVWMCIAGNKENLIQKKSSFNERDCRIAPPKESKEGNKKNKGKK